MLSQKKQLERGRILSFILVLAMLAAVIIPLQASVTPVSAAQPTVAQPGVTQPVTAPVDITVFVQSLDQVWYQVSPQSSTVADIYRELTQQPYDPALIYTIDGKFGKGDPTTQTVSDGELVEYFLVKDYTAYFYATVDPRTAIVIDGTLYTKDDAPSQVLGQAVSFDLTGPYIATYGAVAATPATGGIIVPGDHDFVLDSYLPVEVKVDFTSAYADALTSMSALLIDEGYALLESGELSTTSGDAGRITDEIQELEDALAAAATSGDYNPVVDAYLILGDDIRTVQHVKDGRVPRIAFSNEVAVTMPFSPDLSYSTTAGGYTYTIKPTDGSDIYYGNQLTVDVWAQPGTGYLITADNGATVSGNVVNFGTAGNITNITVNIQGSVPLPRAQRYYRFAIRQQTPSLGVFPDHVNGYLPAPGQYMNGTGWGSISGDDENSLADPAQVKLTKGHAAMGGVSLGSYGGYVQVEYDDPITDSEVHPYGVDFIVYGNAFAGFSEAGAVQVATGITEAGVWVPDTWYELAGSRYYDMPEDTKLASGSFPNSTVDYILNKTPTGAAVDIGFDFYNNFYNNLPNWTAGDYTSNIRWWPNYAAKPTGKNYGNSSGLLLSPSKINTTPEVSVQFAPDDSYLTFGGITKVLSSLAYADYQYGYADVHANGTTDGNAVDPYDTTGGGGDGFDLAWAVDIETGLPVDLSDEDIYFIRVYTAPMNPSSGFGEISTEVTAITTANESHDPVGVTSQPAITVNGTTIPTSEYNNGSILDRTDLGEDTVVVTLSGADNVLLNNEPDEIVVDLSDGNIHYVRTVAQSGTAQPYIVTIKLSRDPV